MSPEVASWLPQSSLVEDLRHCRRLLHETSHVCVKASNPLLNCHLHESTLRYHGADTKLCVADPENSVFYDAWCTGDRSLTLTAGSRIEGIGRPRVEESFLSEVRELLRMKALFSMGPGPVSLADVFVMLLPSLVPP